MKAAKRIMTHDEDAEYAFLIKLHANSSIPGNWFLKTQHLCGALGDGTAGTLATLAAGKVGLLEGLWTLLDDLGTLSEDHLDVAWVGHVWVDLVDIC